MGSQIQSYQVVWPVVIETYIRHFADSKAFINDDKFIKHDKTFQFSLDKYN